MSTIRFCRNLVSVKFMTDKVENLSGSRKNGNARIRRSDSAKTAKSPEGCMDDSVAVALTAWWNRIFAICEEAYPLIRASPYKTPYIQVMNFTLTESQTNRSVLINRLSL